MMRILRFLVAAFAIALTPLASAAQEAPAGPDSAELEALAAELRDEAKRAEIIRRIEALAAAREGSAAAEEEPARGPLASVTDSIVAFGGDVAGSLSFAFEPGVFRQWLEQGFNDPASGAPVWTVLGQALLVLLAGLVVEIAVRRLMASLRRVSSRPESGTVGERLLAAAVALLLGIVPVAAFAAGSFVALSAAALPQTAAELVLAVVYASSAARLAMLAVRAGLAPDAAGARLAPLDDASAAGLLAWLRRLVLAVVYGWLVCEIARVFALPSAPYRLLVDLVGLTVLAVAVSMVLRNRTTVRNRLRGNGEGVRARLADIWHVVAVAYLAAVFLVWAAAVEGGFAYVGAASAWTVAAVAAARLADLGVLRLVEAATRWEVRADSRLPGVKARADRYVPVVRKCLRSAVWLIAAVAALEAWRAPVLDLLAAPVGERILGALVRIALVIGLFLVLWEALCLAIERYLDARDEDGNPMERSGRARTLLPLLRRASAVLLLTVGGLTAASELGIDIAPLLAGVGIAGLAIGFGAQTLVKDVITGLFIVMEDQVAVGEYVSVAGHSGIV
ncbi:MAG: mechanosensitive ion channel, partial [Alphaproteobacteria bacterium]|nr:mechanosensitive ion channel [Alphaproteobacteria bacterium]